MDKKTLFNVEVADQSGHSVVQMNQDEIASKATSDNSAWVFVNDQLVSAADIADMNLEEGSRIRMMPGLVGGNDAPTFVVQTADSTGHSEVVMTQAEIASKATSDNSAWVFVNDQLVSAADIADMNLEEGSRIRMMPGLVGGNDAPTFVVQTADSTGHSEVVMTQAEIASKATSDNSAWVFVNDQLVSAADIADMNLEEGSRIRMMPGLVGGLYC